MQMSWPSGDFLENEALGDTAQFVRRRGYPSDCDLKQKRQEPFPFQGDVEDDREGIYPSLS